MQLLLSFGCAYPIVVHYFSAYGFTFQWLLIANQVLLSMIWTATVLISGLKTFRKLGYAFVLGYSILIFTHSYFNRYNDLTTLLLEFMCAQVVLLLALLVSIIAQYPAQKLIAFDFLKHKNLHYSLIGANFLFCLGFWVDKYLFWFYPTTGYASFPPLHNSPLYDIPMFIAMLSLIPAITVFMLKVESKFALAYPHMMEVIFKGKTLTEIDQARDDIVLSGREAFVSALKAHCMVVVLLFLIGSTIYDLLHISSTYLPLLFILIIASTSYFIVWSILSLFYYMTKYRQAFIVSAFFFVSNGIFTLISLYAGPLFYGYGYALSLILTAIIAITMINKNFRDIEYTTFMMVD